MQLKIGIVGLPNVGKSTLFNALIKQQLAKVADYPFTTIEPHEGTVDVPDQCLIDLTLLVKPEVATPASITFIDIAGLVRGAYQGEGLGNEFLGHIRNVSVVLLVLRFFEHPTAPHPLGSIDPKRDIDILATELVLKDLATIGHALEKEKEQARKTALYRLKEAINRGVPARELTLSQEETAIARELSLLSMKPTLVVANIAESQLGSEKVREFEKQEFIPLSAKLEADILEISPLERQEYLRASGVSHTGLERIIVSAYRLLDLITFFTIKGGWEVRAWPVKRGTTALEAAAEVHTDFAHKFIKAEVIQVPELLTAGGWQQAKEQGKVRLEGRDYLVHDGDVIEFKIGS